MSVNKGLLLVLKSSIVGDCEPDLGLKLVTLFLDMLIETENIPSRIICMGTGVYLTTVGSPVVKQLNKFVEAGTEVLSCGTCLEYYGRKEKLIIGAPTNMKETVRAMVEFEKVLSPN